MKTLSRNWENHDIILLPIGYYFRSVSKPPQKMLPSPSLWPFAEGSLESRDLAATRGTAYGLASAYGL